ncbi:RNA 3'-terminal phosphate cyclase-like [Venturia canescens]|uniref:RNA 3'-terminal phosphate cyclase-like n=1 Tax=Venturia canescens TaxID=32260 RepID=UPI001C9CA13B|nr:RNA 3'-terminal phosphate cyclase-like [Venturia canescens]
MSKLLKIDGSLGEGGGQVLRIAISLSALYGIPVEIENIRAGRPKPGLAAQHLKGVELVQDLCNANVKGGYVGSTRLEFHPGCLKGQKREFKADTQTAGCIGLLAQVALPVALFLPSEEPITIILRGGTNVPMGPHIEYLTEVFRPHLNKFGGDFNFTVLKRGYYPKGGGEVHLKIKPIRSLKAIEMMEPGDPTGISGWSYVAGSVNINEAHRMAEDAKRIISDRLATTSIPIPPINIEAYREDRGMAVGNGSGINIVCQTSSGSVFGGSGLGSNRRDGPPPGIEAADLIIQPLISGSCVDDHIQDQIILLMALAKGRSQILLGEQKLTQHTKTAIQIAEIMLGDRGLHFTSRDSASDGDTGTFILECDGCGLVNEAVSL